MAKYRTFDQHIAVFGESGSGKTVLVSSFYGATQEPEFLQRSLYRVVSDDAGQGNLLHKNYLGMRDEAIVPEATRFAATSYSFSVKLKDDIDAKAQKTRPFDAFRLVWHDYPGEWFEQDVSGPEEATRRVETFRSLLGSDVALFLVDGQKLLDHQGEEERYLRSLFANFRNGLLSLKNSLLPNSKPLVDFPRIWVIALSKADLLPHLDVFGFRDLIIGKAGGDVSELRAVLAEFVQVSDALSVGEDFLLLSSAKFEPGNIEVQERIGLELILPLAAVLPLERHVRWAKTKQIPGQVAAALMGAGALGIGAIATVLLNKRKLPGPLAIVQGIASVVLTNEALDQAAKLTGDKLKEVNAKALAKRNHLTAVLTRFKIDLEHAEAKRVFLRSIR